MFFVGGGIDHDDPPRPRSCEYFGIWLSRPHVLALLPKPVATGASARWAAATIRRRRKDIPKDAKQADLARLLEAESKKAAKTGELPHELKASYFENQLGAWGIWPLDSFE